VQDVIVGLLAIGVGVLVCFRGYLAMRLIIPIWGAFAGFLFGAGLVSAVSDDGFLRTLVAWLVGLVFAAVFAAFAYVYYRVSVFIAMGAVGFTLVSSALVALGVSWSWLAVLGGVVGGIVLALVAIIFDVPGLLLVVLTALAGASTVVFGAMLLTGATNTGEYGSVTATERIDDDWWWYALYIALAAIGMVQQLRHSARWRASLQAQWAENAVRLASVTVPPAPAPAHPDQV
jgi:hypothetical protein